MLSIVIPVFNQHSMTQDCLKAITDNTVDHEVILVDNGSYPPLHKTITTDSKTMRIRNETNLGFPVAVNQGINAAKGEVIVLLNNDCICTQGWQETLLAHLDSYSIVGPTANYCAGLQQVTIPVYQDEQELNKQAVKWAEDHEGESVEVNWIIGFCMAFKKSLWEEIGPFDESLWPCSGEELAFCLEARKRGHKVGIAKDSYIHHFGSQTFNDMERMGQVNYRELCERNESHVREKYGEFWDNQAITPSIPEGIRLNMGSGTFPMKNFINIDQFEHVNPDIQCDILNVPFEPGTVCEIYAGHVLEHFRFDEGMKALRYWHSLLKPNGMISVVVPDYDFLVKEYAQDPSPEKLMVFNDVYIYSGIQPSPHQYAYSADLLKKVMGDAGFKNITRMPVDHYYFPFPVEWQSGFQGTK